jgi:hypothetical protein
MEKSTGWSLASSTMLEPRVVSIVDIDFKVVFTCIDDRFGLRCHKHTLHSIESSHVKVLFTEYRKHTAKSHQDVSGNIYRDHGTAQQGTKR